MALSNSNPKPVVATLLAVTSALCVNCSGTVEPDTTNDPTDRTVDASSQQASGNEAVTPPTTHSSPNDTANVNSSPSVAPSVAQTTTSAPPPAASSDTATSSEADDACTSEATDPGPSPVLRLTRRQYLNTIRDLFGVTPDVSAAFTQPSSASGLGASQGDISPIEVEEFQRAAELIAPLVVTEDSLASVAPCQSNDAPRDCAASFVKSFGTRLYRAPITETNDIERHLTLFDVGAETDYRSGIEILVRGMLQSIRFIYRLEFGATEDASVENVARVQLTDYEVATRLAYTLHDTAPDATLMAAAETHELSTPEGIQRTLTSMLAQSGSTAPAQRFLEELVHLQGLETLDKDTSLYPEWTPELKRALTEQATRFFAYLLTEQAGSLVQLFTSTTVPVRSDLSIYYDSDAEASFSPLAVDDAAGLLTLPAFLALNAKPDESSPIYRGKFVREMLLCQPPPPAPPDIPAAPKVDATASTRERLSQHEVDPDCSGCHRLLDPIGFAFEHYDAIGRYRDMDGDAPVDARGELLAAGDITGPIDGVVDLAGRLASSQLVDECIARQWFRHVFSRLDTRADRCSVQQLVTAFRESGNNLNALPQAIVTTDAFRYRRASVASDATEPSSEVAP